MPRKPRTYLAGMPHHVIQRGNNRPICFFSDENYHAYLDYLHTACQRYGVALHAYVLMTNHSHLLMTPECRDGISQVMQSLGRGYVQHVNKQLKRSGTLWEGRHKSSLIDADDYLLACYRYIELNPVRAAMVDHPGDYPWSSYRANAYGTPNSKIMTHPLYDALATSPKIRQRVYRELFCPILDKEQVHAIRNAANFSMPLGNDDLFRRQLEQVVKRRLGYAKRGRPSKAKG